MTMYTFPESVRLTLVTLFATPVKGFSILILLIPTSLATLGLFGRTALTLNGGLAFLGLTAVFGVAFVLVITLATRRAQKLLWQRSGNTVLTIKSSAVEMSETGKSTSTIPWTVIDAVREVGGYFIFSRAKRSLIALPKNRIAAHDLEPLRRILRAVKGDHARVRS
jgi:hypothetical protein